jgi:hypothetical protein
MNFEQRVAGAVAKRRGWIKGQTGPGKKKGSTKGTTGRGRGKANHRPQRVDFWRNGAAVGAQEPRKKGVKKDERREGSFSTPMCNVQWSCNMQYGIWRIASRSSAIRSAIARS